LQSQLAKMKLEDEKKETENQGSFVESQRSREEVIISSEGGSFLEREEDRISNDIDIYRILSGEEKRTTTMIRNIPNKFKQKNLLEMINLKHPGKYDYFYLPMDLKVTNIIQAYLIHVDLMQRGIRLHQFHPSYLHSRLFP
jgi:hypothetical protein